MVVFYRTLIYYGLSTPTAMACDARYDSRSVAHRFAIQTQTSNRVLAFFVKQCVMDDMGLVRSGVCIGGLANCAGAIEYPGCLQKRYLSLEDLI